MTNLFVPEVLEKLLLLLFPSLWLSSELIAYSSDRLYEQPFFLLSLSPCRRRLLCGSLSPCRPPFVAREDIFYQRRRLSSVVSSFITETIGGCNHAFFRPSYQALSWQLHFNSFNTFVFIRQLQNFLFATKPSECTQHQQQQQQQQRFKAFLSFCFNSV